MKYTTISLKLRSPKGKLVNGIIIVRDNFILSTFSDKNLARQLYEYDNKNGDDVSFNEKLNAYMKRYKDKKRKKIIKEIESEISKMGGSILNKKDG